MNSQKQKKTTKKPNTTTTTKQQQQQRTNKQTNKNNETIELYCQMTNAHGMCYGTKHTHTRTHTSHMKKM